MRLSSIRVIRKILIVDDEPLIALALAEDLEDQGYSTCLASDAADAIAILESNGDISIVFTDIDMPGSMDGLALASAVRNRWPPVEILITTGQTKPELNDMPDRSLFISKPYTVPQIVGAIKSFPGWSTTHDLSTR